jgi:CRP-like cAMP-binding protein
MRASLRDARLPRVRWALFDVVDPEEARAVLAQARRRRFASGEVIFHEGDPGDTMHLIDKGRVAVRITTPLGETATLRILGPGAFFGELALISPSPRNATIVALEPVETMGLHRDHVAELRRDHPAVDRVLLEAAVLEVRRLSTQLVEALYLPVPKRLARRLLELSAHYGPGARTTEPHDPTLIPLTQDDIAELCGTSRQTVNKLLRDLAERGAVTVARGKVSVADRKVLERLAR